MELYETSNRIAIVCRLIRIEMAKKRRFFATLTQITYKEVMPIAEPLCKEFEVNIYGVLKILDVQLPKKNSKNRAA